MATIPVSQRDTAHAGETLEERFQRLAATWRAETAYLSSLTDMTAHPAYREIVSMGQDAVPLLLRDLEKEPEHWFMALAEITGANPVPPQHAGNIDRMAADWLRWGREHGYQW